MVRRLMIGSAAWLRFLRLCREGADGVYIYVTFWGMVLSVQYSLYKISHYLFKQLAYCF
jgi:hypothetical protein